MAIRGATTVDRDDPELIRIATRESLAGIIKANALPLDDIVSAVFTVTLDLCSEFPARAAREMGWVDVPLLCATEIAVPGSQQRCIRVLLHAMSTSRRAGITHVYLRDAVGLRA